MGRVIARGADADEMLEAVMAELAATTSLAGTGEGEDMRDSILRRLASGAGPAVAIADDDLARLADLPRPHVGPIAAALVRRKAAEAGFRPQRVEALADAIPDLAAGRAVVDAADDAPAPETQSRSHSR